MGYTDPPGIKLFSRSILHRRRPRPLRASFGDQGKLPRVLILIKENRQAWIRDGLS